MCLNMRKIDRRISAVPESGTVLITGRKRFSGAAFVKGFKRPLSVAVDSIGWLYVGDLRDSSVSWSLLSRQCRGMDYTDSNAATVDQP